MITLLLGGHGEQSERARDIAEIKYQLAVIDLCCRFVTFIRGCNDLVPHWERVIKEQVFSNQPEDSLSDFLDEDLRLIKNFLKGFAAGAVSEALEVA